MSDKSAMLEDMYTAILDGDADVARQLAERALEAGMSPLETIDEGFVPGIHEVGRLWEEGEYFLPELVTAAEALKAAMAIILPALGDSDRAQGKGRVLIGTVGGDIHDIGITLVGTMLVAHGFEVTNLGADVPTAQFVERARELDADIVCASALLTTTMLGLGELAEALARAGLRARLLVGGAPVSNAWAEQIGAHGYADNAVSAIKVAEQLIGG